MTPESPFRAMAAQKGPLTDEADEVIDAIAKMVAKLTSQQDGVIRQQLVEQLMRAIIKYDAEFRREDGAAAIEPPCATLAEDQVNS